MNFKTPGTVSIITQGCKVNRYDSQVILEDLLDHGWRQLPFGSRADLVIINSCTVTSSSDRDLRKWVRQARRANPSTKILVTGCKAQVDPEGTLGLEEVDDILGNPAKNRILEFIESEKPIEVGKPGFENRVEDRGITRLDGRARPILKIQDGCNLQCVFCIVPRARGKSRSRSAWEIVEQAKILAGNGSREIVLSGIQLGFYRDPEGEARNLESLLELLLDNTEGFRIRLGSILPRHVSPGLVDLFDRQRDRLCPHFHVSLQSGDDGILKAMKRPYRSRHFRELMLELWNRLDEPCLGTDVIAGFPGENEDAFRSTVELLDDLPMAYGHVFPFSMRKGTSAEELGDTVSPMDKKRRAAMLRSLFEKKRNVYMESQVGSHRNLLVERPHKPGWVRGTTENYQQLLLPEQTASIGDIVKVQVDGLMEGILYHQPRKQRTRA